MNLHLQVDFEDEALTALALDGAELRVKVVGDRAGVGPVQREDEGGNLLGRVDSRVERVLARPQGLAPDAPMPRLHDRAELELGPRCVECGQPHVALDHSHLALVDHQHPRRLDPNQERVQKVRAIQQRVVLEPDPAAAVHESLEVLVVVVQLVLGAEKRLYQLRVGDVRLDLQVLDVLEGADPPGNVRGRQRLAVERGHDADHVLVALGRDHRDPKLLLRQSKRLRRQRAGGHDGAVDGQAVRLGRRDH